MRKTLTSIAVVGAAAATLAAGGAYSVFNDAGASTGGLTAGTVKLSVNGQIPATDVFALTGPCTTSYADNTSPKDALNLGTVNNTGCVSTFTVHNAGSLPFELSGTTVSDTNPVGLTCVTSTITDGTSKTAALLPGADRVVTVSTVTSGDDKKCQNLTDTVTASLVATESVANHGGCFDSPEVVDLQWDGVYGLGGHAYYVNSSDGTCSNGVYYRPAVVQAASYDEAFQACQAIGGTSVEPRLWPNLPDDAWSCDWVDAPGYGWL